MRRLIEKGLMFGNLVEVASPVLVERYNRALYRLSGKRTRLPDFHIDISGFSPEIADELGDWDYLNPRGCNRQFILLTTEQQTAPLLNAKFSTSRGVLKQFIAANAAQLFALTARDAVLGELENTVFEIDGPGRLFDLRGIIVTADTTEAHVANARELESRITRFRTEPDAWHDDVLIAEMIDLARQTGDVTRNPLVLDQARFDQPTFWTSHYGGVYVFGDAPKPGLVCPNGAPRGDLPKNVLAYESRSAIASYLEANAMVEPVAQAPNPASAAILRQKIDFILVDAAAMLGLEVRAGDRRTLRRLGQSLGGSLPDEARALLDRLRWAEGTGTRKRIGADHPAYFYTLRARPDHPDRDVINQLLAELSPLDVRQLFICHKPLFYRLYRNWPDAKKSFVADFLEAEYMMDKVGARAALFGPADPSMGEPDVEDNPIAAVGPWGAVSRARR